MKPKQANPKGRRILVITPIIAFIVAFSVGLPTAASVAGSANSNIGHLTVAGKTYENYANIRTGSNYARATTYTGPYGHTATVGTVGSRGRLFAAGGLTCEGSNQYNSVNLISGGKWSGQSCLWITSSGSFRSYGVSLAWNGSSYQSFYTFQTVYQNVPG